MKKQNKKLAVVLYVFGFYGLWSLCEICIFRSPNILPKNEILSQFLKSAVIKNLIWILPAALLIHRFREEVYVSLKEMFSSKVRWLRYLPLFALFTVYILVGAVLQKGGLKIAPEFGFEEVLAVLFVGITEEMVFRGWLLNLTYREEKKVLCILGNALMFLAIHFPIWLREGVFIENFTGLGFLCIIGLSVIFSHAFLKSKNILVPIALHMYWDLIMFLFFD